MSTKNEVSSEEIEKIALDTLESIQKGENSNVKKLFEKVELLFKKGNNFSQTLISTKFIYPITTLLEMNYSWGIVYIKMLPVSLKTEYHSQVYSSGI